MRVIHAETGMFTDVMYGLLPLLLSGEEGNGDGFAKYIQILKFYDLLIASTFLATLGRACTKERGDSLEAKVDDKNGLLIYTKK
jgi:hypothetical protein